MKFPGKISGNSESFIEMILINAQEGGTETTVFQFIVIRLSNRQRTNFWPQDTPGSAVGFSNKVLLLYTNPREMTLGREGD